MTDYGKIDWWDIRDEFNSKEPEPKEKPEMDAEYPYWKTDYDKEMNGLEVWYQEVPPLVEAEVIDGYHLFMSMCGDPEIYKGKTRMDILKLLKDATEDEPLVYRDEVFWCEKV
jgi:hypothetical protein